MENLGDFQRSHAGEWQSLYPRTYPMTSPWYWMDPSRPVERSAWSRLGVRGANKRSMVTLLSMEARSGWPRRSLQPEFRVWGSESPAK